MGGGSGSGSGGGVGGGGFNSSTILNSNMEGLMGYRRGLQGLKEGGGGNSSPKSLPLQTILDGDKQLC